MNWYLIHTKPRQERIALQNLEAQGYVCYLPVLPTERLRQGSLTVANEPLFPRYLFIQLEQGESAKSWSPIRSTKGVSRLVSFGTEPAKVDDRLIALLKSRETSDRDQPLRLFARGDRVRVVDGVFAGIEGIYQMAEAENRAMVLIELMSKPVTLSMAPVSLRKAG